MERLDITLRWDAHVHQWHASCAAHPGIVARAPTPSRARGALLRKIKAVGGQFRSGQVSETFLLPDACLAKHEQWRAERAAAVALQASVAAFECDLVLSLRNLRLSIAQIARTLELAPQHVDAVLQRTAMRACMRDARGDRSPALREPGSLRVQIGEPSSADKQS